MRINELRDKLFDLGDKHCLDFRIEEINMGENTTYIDVDINYPGGQFTIVTFVKEKQYSLNIFDDVIGDLPEELQEKLFEIFVDFARTPTDEREEEKKYQYRLKGRYWWFLGDFEYDKIYLNLVKNETIEINDKDDFSLRQSKFTDEEIEDILDEYYIDLNMFDKIEVK